jgi:hypothetical protein
MSTLLDSSMNILPPLSSLSASTEGARRASEVLAESAARAEPEVVASAKRRQFSANEKRRLLNEAERSKARGELGAFLRRERIYSSVLSMWRMQVGAADQVALTPKRRGPKPDAVAKQIAALTRDSKRVVWAH